MERVGRIMVAVSYAGRRGTRAKAGKSTRRLRVLNPAARCVNTGAHHDGDEEE
jgi:hypothetical protein